MTSSDEEEALLLLALAETEEVGKKRKRKKWIHEINELRESYGEYHTLMPLLRADEKRFYIYFRMMPNCFDKILNLIKADIRKIDTNCREAITQEERLAITLRFLATGDSYYTIGHSYRIGFSTEGKIVQEVCGTICKEMEGTYLPEPSVEMWKASAKKIEDVWKFPNCIGSLDMLKHVTIQCPKKSGSNYFCYLHKFSIVLMAVVDADYKFMCVDIVGYGKNSDGGILEVSNMGRRFEKGRMNVPEPKPLPGQNLSCPYVLIGDEGFGLKPYLMRPYPYRQSRADIRKENYNTRLCKARRVVENAFGILLKKWRIFYRPIQLSIETTILIVKTTCILHNFLRKESGDDKYFEDLEPPESRLNAFQDLSRDPKRAVSLAFEIREKFLTYFNS